MPHCTYITDRKTFLFDMHLLRISFRYSFIFIDNIVLLTQCYFTALRRRWSFQTGRIMCNSWLIYSFFLWFSSVRNYGLVSVWHDYSLSLVFVVVFLLFSFYWYMPFIWWIKIIIICCIYDIWPIHNNLVPYAASQIRGSSIIWFHPHRGGLYNACVRKACKS